ncbi:MAG: prephenate dehydratase [Tenuifilaceae bacterium]
MKKTVSIQGIRGAFHQEAAEKYFGSEIEIVECLTFSRLVNSVEFGESNFGIMAIENSLVGSILPNYALIRESTLKITGELYLRIEQNLIAQYGENIDTINEVRSHPMALAQCSNFFKSLPSIKLVECEDTALSAKQIAELKLKGIATVASKNAALEYGLDIISPSIESNKENYTRFLILEKSTSEKVSELSNKASITFTAKHQPGSLLNVLQPFADVKINLTMLQSLPVVGKRWEYIFHADLVFDSLPDFRFALEFARKHTTSLQVLGIYQSHETIAETEKYECLNHYC